LQKAGDKINKAGTKFVVILRIQTAEASFENLKGTSMKPYFGLCHAVCVRKLIRIPDLKQKKSEKAG
jgi:hypothetical protein